MFCCLTFLPSPLQMCMGLCNQDVTEEGKRAKLQNSIIEHDICEHAKSELNVTKILMLGAAESGKSTLVKQIKIIHSHGFSKQELISFKPAVLNNLLTSMKFVLQGMGKLRINLANKKNKVHARAILSCVQCYGEDQELLPFVAHAFYALWTDQGVRTAAARGAEFELNDSALYFFENISRFIAPNFIPSEMDLLRARVRTCGIIETQFEVNETIFRLYDVGAQQSLKRKKWLGCFDCVQAVLFVVDLSGYDVNMMDDPSPGTHRSRLQASLDLFTSIYTNTVFKDTPWFLFMNKTDLFREKILYSGRHLRLYLPSYKGADGDVDAAAYHIATMFLECNNKPNKPIYHHFTIATDTSNIRVVFEVLMEQITEKENGDRIATMTLL